MAIVANSTSFGRHFGPLQELLDFAIMEIPEAALTPEMLGKNAK
jgi:hypothetical protein